MKTNTCYTAKVAVFVLSLLFMVGGCADDAFLSMENNAAVTSEETFSDYTTADLFLNDIYNSLPDLNQDGIWDPLDNISDNAMCGLNWAHSIQVYSRQSVTVTPGSDFTGSTSFIWFRWGILYSNIRKCNVFIQEVERSSLIDIYKVYRTAEAKVLRAFFYHILWTRYGGVPLIDRPDNREADGEGIFHRRASADETFEFMMRDLDDAIAALPPHNGNDGGGRVNLGAALMLKSYIQLFHASTLRNPENDLRRWVDAAETASNIFELGYSLYPEYDKLFWSNGNSNNEGVFYRQYLARVKPSLIHTKYGPAVLGARWLSWGGSNPSQNLVDDYHMANGRPITDPSSGYDPQDPYKDREPRFYQSILYNGSEMQGLSFTTALNAGSNNTIDLSDTNDNTNTGYAQRKRMDESIDLWDFGASSQNYYFFRFAEALLIYAEAKNEADGPDATVYAAIDHLRLRAGIAPLSELYPAMTQEEMRAAIRRERRLELAFEDKRYLDLLRWKTAEVELNKPLQAMKITKQPDGTFFYEQIDAPGGERSFSADRNYLLPLPESALATNGMLTQNPGY